MDLDYEFDINTPIENDERTVKDSINEWKNFWRMAFYAIVPAVFIVIQPDMGMTMVLFFMVVGVLYAGGLDKRIILGGFGALILAIVIVVEKTQKWKKF